jgi:hypothetical protein
MKHGENLDWLRNYRRSGILFHGMGKVSINNLKSDK